MKTFLVFPFILIVTSLFSVESLLPIPPVISGAEIKLNIQNGELILPTGTTKTMGYNGNYLGPTIVVSRNDFVKFNIHNQLKEDTTVHWHGLHVPAEYDGGPRQVIKSGMDWKPAFKIAQPAATLWYHPHLMGKTAEHAYNGLAGMFYIYDDYSKSLNIPQDYGVNDLPIILQDRQINRDGSFRYQPNRHEVMSGYLGNTLLVNGAVEPLLKIDAGTYRLRILNGSNSSIMRVRFSNAKKFTVIASDGGFLPKSISLEELVLSPGERFEILVDFAPGEKATLVTDSYRGASHTSLNIVTSSKSGTFYPHPKEFEFEQMQFDKSSNTKRTFVLETRMMGQFTINGNTMSLGRIDQTVPLNTSEIWRIENKGNGMMQVPHSFHVHNVQFSVVSVNGKKPDGLYSGPKDTILVMPGDVYEISLGFKNYKGIYMYHCHFLEHEDEGMMGQFAVE